MKYGRELSTYNKLFQYQGAANKMGPSANFIVPIYCKTGSISVRTGICSMFAKSYHPEITHVPFVCTVSLSVP